MENATKALIMAGSVLLALILVSALVMVFQNASRVPKSEAEIKEIEQVAKFNLEFESYARGKNVRTDWLSGADVISVINKAISNNERYSTEPNYQIEIVVEIKGKSFSTRSKVTDAIKTRTIEDGLNTGIYNFTIDRVKYNSLVNNTDSFHDFKTARGFICYEVEYNKTTGRVSKLIFREVTKELMEEDIFN